MQVEFETVIETAKRLGVNVRTVQKWAAAGKIFGAKKVGRDWLIPSDAQHPGKQIDENDKGQKIVTGIPLPLLNSNFEPGHCLDFINLIENEDDRNIALSEYYYYLGDAQKSAEISEPYLSSDNQRLRFSAALCSLFANLSLERVHLCDFAAELIKSDFTKSSESDYTPEYRALGVFAVSTVETQFHIEKGIAPPLEEHIHFLPSGLKIFACYLLAYKAYLQKDYNRSLGICEIGLCLPAHTYPLAKAHLHIVAVMALMNLLRTDEAMMHIDASWQLLKEDNFIMPYVEHHGMLHGMIEKYFKKNHPEVLKKILYTTSLFNGGWYDIYNKQANKKLEKGLTTTEFTVAMLFNRGWRVKEIAHHMELSERTIKNYLQVVYEKLGISGRKELEQFMLR